MTVPAHDPSKVLEYLGEMRAYAQTILGDTVLHAAFLDKALEAQTAVVEATARLATIDICNLTQGDPDVLIAMDCMQQVAFALFANTEHGRGLRLTGIVEYAAVAERRAHLTRPAFQTAEAA